MSQATSYADFYSAVSRYFNRLFTTSAEIGDEKKEESLGIACKDKVIYILSEIRHFTSGLQYYKQTSYWKVNNHEGKAKVTLVTRKVQTDAAECFESAEVQEDITGLALAAIQAYEKDKEQKSQ